MDPSFLDKANPPPRRTGKPMKNFEIKTHALSEQSKYREVKNLLASYLPLYSMRSSIGEYKKQLVETRTLLYHQQNLRMISKEELIDPLEKKRFVIKRVARELWTNFCVRGQDTPMLQHLHTSLREEFGEDLQFHYLPGSIELIIMRQGEKEMEPLERMEQVSLINRAWQISQEVVSSYTT